MAEGYLNTLCPTCSRPLSYVPGGDPVTCESCGNTWTANQLERHDAPAAPTSAAAATTALIASIDNSDSALAYLESFFEEADWEDFYRSSDLSFPQIDRMVQNILVKSAANPVAWELRFRSVAIPLQKKLEGLAVLEKEFLARYQQTDILQDDDSLSDFDMYRRTACLLHARQDELLKDLEHSLQYATRHALAAEALEPLTAMLQQLRTALAAVKPVAKYQQLPGYAAAEKAKQERVSRELSDRGIQAERVYASALEAYRKGNHSNEVLSDFESIGAYKDAATYAQQMNVWVDLTAKKSTMIRIADKYFLLRPVTPLFNVKNGANVADAEEMTEQEKAQQEKEEKEKIKKMDEEALAAQQEEEAVAAMKRLELVPVNEEHKPAEKAAVTGITKLLGHHGKYLYFIRDNRAICKFNSDYTDAAVEVLHQARVGDYEDVQGNIRPVVIGNTLFLRTKLHKEAAAKLGCFANAIQKIKNFFLRLFGKLKPEEVNRNNYSLLKIDLNNDTIETVLPELVDVLQVEDTQIFFTRIEREEGIERERFCALNARTGEVEQLLGANCDICGATRDYVAYMLWMPDAYNRDLYVIRLADKEKCLLEKNIYRFYGIIGGRIYYTVGNEKRRVLFSILPDGTDRTEVMREAARVEGASLHNGWLYLTRGKAPNTALFRVRADGREATCLCTQYRRQICMKGGYLFYLDCDNSLCMVKVDGTQYQRLVEDVVDTFVYDDEILLTRRENGTMSLYRVDADGSNLRKVVYDISCAQANPYDQNELYLYRTEQVTYAIHTPISATEYSTQRQKVTVEKFVLYDRAANTCTDVLKLGEPDMTSMEFKTGCLFHRKTVKKDSKIEIIPHQIVFHYKNAATAGAVSQEMDAKEQALKDRLKNLKKGLSNRNR